MRVFVPVGTYRIMEDKRVCLHAGPAGAGVVLGALNKETRFSALAFFLFPRKNQTISVEDNIIFSGEELLEYFWDELKEKNEDLKGLTWVLAGASKFKSGLNDFKLMEENVGLARNFLTKRVGIENFYEFIFKPTFVLVELDSSANTIRILYNGGMLCL
jgi:chemotaxis receptor (MCP) glutamine deamidase CheD